VPASVAGFVEDSDAGIAGTPPGLFHAWGRGDTEAPSALGVFVGCGEPGGTMTPYNGSGGGPLAIGALEQPVANAIPRLSEPEASSEIHRVAPRACPACPVLVIFARPPILRCAASPIKKHRHTKRETFNSGPAEKLFELTTGH
jgi:hypothetical protein